MFGHVTTLCMKGLSNKTLEYWIFLKFKVFLVFGNTGHGFFLILKYFYRYVINHLLVEDNEADN